MRICVAVEPQYLDTLWCRQTLMGIEAACARKKYALTQGALEDIIAGCGREAPVIVVGTSESWVPHALASLKGRGTQAVLVSYLDTGSGSADATVTIAHGPATAKALACLRAWGRPRTALYGMNPDSSADRAKCRAFARMGGQAADVYANTGSLAQCADSFFAHAARYDGVILANDIVAVSFLKRARAAGVRVPEDLYAISFGGCQIARHVRPTLTSIALDHEALGRQAVAAAAYLVRQGDGARLAISVPAAFTPGESNGLRPIPAGDAEDAGDAAPAVNFYEDPESDAILRLETLFSVADETDLALLLGIQAGRSQEALAEACHVAPGTVKYRFRRMLKISGLKDREALQRLLACYLIEGSPSGER